MKFSKIQDRFSAQDKLVPQLLIAVALGIAIVVARTNAHVPNFAPVTAIALFGGFLFARAHLALVMIVFAMMVSDLLIGFDSWAMRALVYGCFFVPVLLGSLMRRKDSMSAGFGFGVFGAALGSSVLFFLVSNFAVFLWSGMYTHNWAGLSLCYLNAIPFYRATLASDMVFTLLFFGSHHVVVRLALRQSHNATTASS